MDTLLYPLTVVICYLAVEAIKQSGIKKEWLPMISLAMGGILCGVGFALGIKIETTLASAIIKGILCGLAATGGDQAYKHAAELIRGEKIK